MRASPICIVWVLHMYGTMLAPPPLPSSAVLAEYWGGPEAVRPHLSGDGPHAALDYWERLRGHRAFPARADLDPMVLRRHLPAIFLLDAAEDGCFRYRVVGALISEYFGPGSPVGRTPEEIYGDQAEVALAPLRLVRDRRCLYMHASSARYIRHHRNYVYYSLLLLPLGNSDARVDKIVGVVTFISEDEAARA